MPSAEPATACAQGLVLECLIETGSCSIEIAAYEEAVDVDTHIQRIQKIAGVLNSLIQNYNTISYIMIKNFKNHICNF
jgi:endonuclease III